MVNLREEEKGVEVFNETFEKLAEGLRIWSDLEL